MFKEQICKKSKLVKLLWWSDYLLFVILLSNMKLKNIVRYKSQLSNSFVCPSYHVYHCMSVLPEPALHATVIWTFIVCPTYVESNFISQLSWLKLYVPRIWNLTVCPIYLRVSLYVPLIQTLTLCPSYLESHCIPTYLESHCMSNLSGPSLYTAVIWTLIVCPNYVESHCMTQLS